MDETGVDVSWLAAAVDALQAELNRADRAIAAATGVGSAEDLQVLRLLLVEGPMRVGALARERASSMTTASGRIGRLEKKGMVKRERIAGDLRAMLVTLTEAGAEVAARSHCDRLQSLAPIAPGFPFEALDSLIGAMANGANGEAV